MGGGVGDSASVRLGELSYWGCRNRDLGGVWVTIHANLYSGLQQLACSQRVSKRETVCVCERQRERQREGGLKER